MAINFLGVIGTVSGDRVIPVGMSIPAGSRVYVITHAGPVGDSKDNGYTTEAVSQHSSGAYDFCYVISSLLSTGLEPGDEIYCGVELAPPNYYHYDGIAFAFSGLTDGTTLEAYARGDGAAGSLELINSGERLIVAHISVVDTMRVGSEGDPSAFPTADITGYGFTVAGECYCTDRQPYPTTEFAAKGGHQIVTAPATVTLTGTTSGGYSGDPPGSQPQQATWLIAAFKPGTPPADGDSGSGATGPGLLSFDRDYHGRMNLAWIDTSTGALAAHRYDDAVPEGVAATQTVESESSGACSLRVRRSGIWDLLHVRSNTVYHRLSRDRGRTFGVATTIASGYQGVTHVLDEARGLLVAALYDTANTRWMLTVGTLDSGGTAWSFSTPALLVSGAKNAGQLRIRADGTYEFAYVNSSSAVSILRCKSLSRTGAGSWS